VDEALAALGRTRRVVFTTPYFLGAMSLVAQTDLVATLPRKPAEQAAQGLGARLVEAPLVLPTVPIYLQWHERLHDDPGHSWIRDRFAQGPEVHDTTG